MLQICCKARGAINPQSRTRKDAGSKGFLPRSPQLAGKLFTLDLSEATCANNTLELRWAGTWAPLLECLLLSKHLLEQQHTKKLQGTKNNCMHVQLGQITNDKIQKGHKPTATSEVPGAKAGYCARSLHTARPRRWADYLNHPSGPTHQPPLPSPHVRSRLAPPRKQTRAPVSCFCSLMLQHECQ